MAEITAPIPHFAGVNVQRSDDPADVTDGDVWVRDNGLWVRRDGVTELYRDYEEGTLVPTLAFGFGGVGAGVAYFTGYPVVRWVRIGDLVNVWYNVTITNNGSESGQAILLDALPYEIVHDLSGRASGAVKHAGMTGLAAGQAITAWLTEGNGPNLYFSIGDTGSGQMDPLLDTHMVSNPCQVQGHIAYRRA